MHRPGVVANEELAASQERGSLAEGELVYRTVYRLAGCSLQNVFSATLILLSLANEKEHGGMLSCQVCTKLGETWRRPAAFRNAGTDSQRNDYSGIGWP